MAVSIQENRTTALTVPEYDVERIRQDFPILNLEQSGHRLVYLDNAATAQTPQAVIDALVRYYTHENANVHRGVHFLSQRATDRYEEARSKIARFLNTPVGCQLIFTRGTTDAINLVASSYGDSHVQEGDEIIISHMEHHSNIVPWQMLCERKNAHLKVIPINDAGELILDEYARMISPRAKLVAITHVSNALGTINPVEDIIRMAHEHGVPVLVDGAQAVPHMPTDLKKIDCDFYVFSGHKVYGPTGIGCLYGNAKFLNDMPPYQGGGDMIVSVTFEKTTYNSLPYKFEAGTPNIADAIALGAAIDYLSSIGMDKIAAHEHELLQYGTEALQSVKGIRLIGTARNKAGVLSFTMEHAHPHDIGQLLDEKGIAIRAGHHCAQPVMQRFNVPATARASLGMYNTREEIDMLVEALHHVNKVFS